MTENEIATAVFQCGIKIHKTLGPGLLEKIYEECLCIELEKAGIKFEQQKLIPIIYNERQLKTYFQADLIVEDKVLIEIKSVIEISNIHHAQILTYLKLTNPKLGLLINFNVPLFKYGFKRVVLGDIE